MVTVDSGNQVAVWRPWDDQPRLTWQLPADAEVTNIAVADGVASTLLLAAQSDGRLALFDVESGQMTRASLDCHAARFTVAASSEWASGPIHFATSAWPELRLWSISGGEVTHQDLPIDSEQDGPFVLRFARLGDRNIIAGAGGDSGDVSSLHVWDADDGSLIAHTRLEQARGMALLDVDIWETAGQPFVLSGGYACSLALWSLGTGEEHHLWVGSPLWFVRSLPGDRVVVAGSRGIMAFHEYSFLIGRDLRDLRYLRFWNFDRRFRQMVVNEDANDSCSHQACDKEQNEKPKATRLPRRSTLPFLRRIELSPKLRAVQRIIGIIRRPWPNKI